MPSIGTPAGYIDDGYTIDFEIKEVEGLHVGLTGKRRPFTERDLQNFLSSMRESSHKVPAKLPPNMTAYEWVNSKIDDARSKGVASRLVEWDLVDGKGESVLITPEAISRINPPELLGKLLNEVVGFADRPESGELKDAADTKN